MSDDTRFHAPIQLAEVRSRRVRAGRAIVEPCGRPDCLYATSGPVPLEPPTSEELADEALNAYLKSMEPKPRWWERSALVAVIVACAAGVASFLAQLIKKVFS